MSQLILHHTYVREWPLTYRIIATTAGSRTSSWAPVSAGSLRKMICHQMLGRLGGQTHRRWFTPSGKEFNSTLLLRDVANTQTGIGDVQLFEMRSCSVGYQYGCLA